MKNVIFFGIGAILGSVVTYFCVKDHYRELAESEIEEIREMYRKKTASKETAEKNEEAKKAMLNDISNEPKEESPQMIRKRELKIYDKIREPYVESHNVFSNPLNEDEIDNEEEFTDDPYELVVDRSTPSDGYSEPHEISEEEFASERLFYDKAMVFYYTDDVAVLEETDEIIDSIEDLIGPDILPEAMEKLDIRNGNDTIYVRNDNRSTDYGIIFTGTEFVQEEEPD